MSHHVNLHLYIYTSASSNIDIYKYKYMCVRMYVNTCTYTYIHKYTENLRINLKVNDFTEGKFLEKVKIIKILDIHK